MSANTQAVVTEMMSQWMVLASKTLEAQSQRIDILEARLALADEQVSTLSDHVHGLQAKRRVGRKPRA